MLPGTRLAEFSNLQRKRKTPCIEEFSEMLRDYLEQRVARCPLCRLGTPRSDLQGTVKESRVGYCSVRNAVLLARDRPHPDAAEGVHPLFTFTLRVQRACKF